jgi:hypothetical protein
MKEIQINAGDFGLAECEYIHEINKMIKDIRNPVVKRNVETALLNNVDEKDVLEYIERWSGAF